MPWMGWGGCGCFMLSELSPTSAVALGVGNLGPMPRAVSPARSERSRVDSDAFALDAFQTACVVDHIRAGSKSRQFLSVFSLIIHVVETIPVLRCRACQRCT